MSSFDSSKEDQVPRAVRDGWRRSRAATGATHGVEGKRGHRL